MARNTLTYAEANQLSGLNVDKRMTASKVPHKIPTTIASDVIFSVMTMPCHR
ncbi:hypothetical protein D3C80_2120530 [compost metagenome]